MKIYLAFTARAFTFLFNSYTPRAVQGQNFYLLQPSLLGGSDVQVGAVNLHNMQEG